MSGGEMSMREEPSGIKPGRIGERRNPFIIFSFTLFLTGFYNVRSASAVSSVNVPIGHWSYDALDRLAGYGLLRSDIKGLRPVSRVEAARLVNEAVTDIEYTDKKLPRVITRLLEKLKKEFEEELSEFSQNGATFHDTFMKPINELQMRYVYVDGEPRTINGFRGARAFIRATDGTRLVYNNEGVVYGEHHNLTAQFSSSMRLLGFFSGHLEPIFMLRQNSRDLQDFQEVKADLLKGYAKFSAFNFEIEAGRDSLWWGQGHHGTLMLTNNATPLDMIKVSNPTPILLPWYFRYLGLMKYSGFIARMEDDRQDFPHPLFAGLRLQLKPFPIFEFGATTTFMFNGEGAPQLSFNDFISMIGFWGSVSNVKANQLAAIDARLRLPFLRNAEIYGEYGGEDSGSSRPEELLFRDLAYIVGVYFPRVTDDGKTDFRLEYANNAHRKDSLPSFWYGHVKYTDGYTQDGLIMGHHMSGDSTDLFARATRYLTEDLVLGVDYDHMTRGETLRQPTQGLERIHEMGTDLTYDITSNLSITGRYAYGDVTNFNLVRGDDRDNHLFMTTFRWEF
jgi:hypothetical protein